MIAADRIVRLARNLVGEVDDRSPRRVDPIEDLPYPHELDLEDRATVLRLWSGEVDEISFFNGRIPPSRLRSQAEREISERDEVAALDLLRDLVVDAQAGSRPLCGSVRVCSCSTARAWRFLVAAGKIVDHPVDDEEPF